jgi:hypothetical protein
MAKRKPKLSEPAAQRYTREPGPEDDLRHCILYLVSFGGSSLEELSKATGIELDTVDSYMVGQKPVTRELVEQFCKVAGTSLPRVELALPIVRWPYKLLASKKIPTMAETDRETQIEIKALEIAFSAYDSFLAGLRIRGGPHASALDASFQSLAGKYASLAAEAYRVEARAGQQSEMAVLASEDGDD